MKYRRKAPEVEAWRINLAHAVPSWVRTGLISGQLYWQGGDTPYFTLARRTRCEMTRAMDGDWIVGCLQDDGSWWFHFRSHEDFLDKYEEVPNDPAQRESFYDSFEG